MANKLNYTIVGKRTQEAHAQKDGAGNPQGDAGTVEPLICYDIEWSHDDGPVTDHHFIPVTHPPEIKYEKREAGQRNVIKDQVNVDAKLPEDMQLRIVAAELERKRPRLAEALGVAP